MTPSRNSMVPKRMLKILTTKPMVIFFVALTACGSPVVGPSSSGKESPSTELVIDASPSIARPGISEIEARELLDRMFREAGLRVVNDVFWTEEAIEVTLDGYDPERKIGYEYIASAEAGTELDAPELKALAARSDILLAEACSQEELVTAAEDFLASLEGPGVPSDPSEEL